MSDSTSKVQLQSDPWWTEDRCRQFRRKPEPGETGDSVLEAIENSRVFRVTHEHGLFCVEEACDDYFKAWLSREQLIQLAHELLELAGPAPEPS